ncbi:MAG TPA: saccharopine dehydrogenase NADP-binding domain-containing protein [Longimicrobiales bacterium]|nr:saccharopine dehydrogenase NADP-binding domain-containing protein [Longimicrobiales bacterium]
MTEPRYDVVVFGATGFTGRQLAERLAQHRDRERFTFAIAGRNADKLASLRDALGGGIDVLLADASDPSSIRAMVRSARVVASTAGPFALYSDAVVEACVELGRHYTDITGETPWVRTLIDRHHDAAAAAGVRIVPMCGFDSVPSDLGAWMVVDFIRTELGQGTREVKGFHSMRGGGLNGGTLASALNMAERGQRRAMGDPFLLDPESERRTEIRHGSRGQREPRFDVDLGRWTAPFVMEPINTRVVRRSAALSRAYGEPYGDDFSYRESLVVGSRTKATALTLGFGLADALLRTGSGRALFRRLGPKPGEGPSERAMERGLTRLHLVGTADDGTSVRCDMTIPGDAGNRATVTLLSESALALALDGDSLPTQRGGLLTPATAFGPVLVQRLRDAGVQISMRTSSPKRPSQR